MRTKTLILACASTAGLLIAAPSFAQTTGGGVGGTFNNGSDHNLIVNDLLDVFAVDNAADSYSTSMSYQANNNSWSNSPVVAYQELKAMNINHHLDEVVDMDGADDRRASVGYNSGSQSVNDNAFAAFAGISNAAWNSGINANTQAATNIAARGTINFGVSGTDSAGSTSGD
ncbi:hypothetical protein [Stakelama marina]|uniref:Uncharacterized protein n=1 Tax=Stakelama marina TaxID=2826939 RepID=A0A8T4IBN4_9SPHN|nr:hypothetical protein [Stakelama marina]MBR0551853.1 hypothetical protein [Stakelama marina]